MSKREPLILDFDDSVGPIPGATTLALSDWQEAIRFGCTLRTFNRLREALDTQMPADYGTVLMGSGDYHHLTWPLVERQRSRGPFQVVVFDNHPDNMRFPWGIHCGSWVRRVAMLPYVTHVHVVGITSGDMDVDVNWASRLGLADAFRRFDDPDALTSAFVSQLKQAPQPTYLSIDKDAFSVDTARTNWDQGRLEEQHAMAIIEALRGRIVASDINGEVSAYRYRTWWKRMLSGMDGQEPVPQSELDAWQMQQRAFNALLLAAIAASSV
jgi:hypothetical protein